MGNENLPRPLPSHPRAVKDTGAGVWPFHQRAAPAIAVIDENGLGRECFSLGLRSLDPRMTVHAVATVADLEPSVADGKGLDAVIYNMAPERAFNERVTGVIRRLKEIAGETPVILISDVQEVEFVLEGLRLGIRGMILPSLSLGVTLEAVRLVSAGGTFIPATLLHKVAHHTPWPGAPPPAPEPLCERVDSLTPREVAVLACLREGKSNKIIAYQLGMCENTAKAHVRNVLKKLGASNRTQAVYMAQRRAAASVPTVSERGR